MVANLEHHSKLATIASLLLSVLEPGGLGAAAEMAPPEFLSPGVS